MLMDTITMLDGSKIINTNVDSGANFPVSATTGELFFKTTAPIGLHVYDGVSWNLSGTGSTVPTVSTSPPTGGSDNDVWYQI